MPDQSPTSKADLLSQWKNRRKPADRSIQARPADASLAPASGQRRLWLLQAMYPDNPFYQYGHLYRFNGPLEVNLLEQCLAQLMERHELLRSNYVGEDEETLRLVIRPTDGFQLRRFDLTELPQERREREAKATALRESQRPFDLAEDPLFRASLLRLADDKHWLVISMHHIIGDRGSLLILEQELYQLYTERAAGRTLELTPLPIQFADYAHWKNQRPVPEKSLTYWRELLGTQPPHSALPFDRHRPQQPSFRGGMVSLPLSPALSAGIRDLARAAGATNNVVLLAAYQTLLLRYGAQKDLTVGSPVSVRDRTELENMIGFLNETVVLRAQFSGDESFAEHLRQVNSQVLNALEHKEVAFDELVNHLRPERQPGANPLFQNMFVYNNEASEARLPEGLTVGGEMLDLGVAKFDLTLFATDHGDHFSLTLEFARDLFDEATAERLLRHQTELLTDAVARPDTPVSRLRLLPAEEQKTMLLDWNETTTDLPRPASVLALIQSQINDHPRAIAVADATGSITYGELGDRAATLAAELRPLLPANGTPVGLCAEAGVELIVGLLGIMWSGAAYVPLDPAYPAARLAYVTQDAGIDTVVVTGGSGGEFPGLRTLAIPQRAGAELPALPLPAADDLAYLIYTSGSTGDAKGVAITHANLVHSTTARFAFFDAQPTAFLLLSSFAFDSSVAGIFWTLSQGGKLVLPPRRSEQDMAGLGRLLRYHSISHTLLLPSLYQLLLDLAPAKDLASLNTVMVAGEACPPSLVTAHFQRLPGVALVNEYGPTEGTVWCTAHHIRPEDAAGAVPIGRPIPNVKNYVLDAHFQPLPPGVPGRLYLAGPGLAREYWRRPELTAERFLTVDLGADAGANALVKGARLYDTGDLASYRPDGVIDFLGRADQQVKIRGFRVEPEEISRHLDRLPAVREAVTIVDSSGAAPRLMAYYTLHEPATEATLRQSLAATLPEYMVPALLVELPELPRLPNGKADLRRLPTPAGRPANTTTRPFAPPATATEQTLAEVWEKVLGHAPVGRDDNYFAIGGDSIRSIRVIAHARREGLELETNHIFRYQTVRELAAALDQETQAGSPAGGLLVPLRETGHEDPLICIHSGGGHVFFYQPLAQALPASRPVYAIQPATLAGEEDLPESIEEMAADYVREILKFRPKGPYHLLGTCFSNVVVMEMARQLTAAGKEVGQLIFVDSGPTRLEKLPEVKFTPARTALRILREGNLKLLRRALYRRWYYVRQALGVPLENEEQKKVRLTTNALYQLYFDYTWRPTDAAVTLIRSSEFAGRADKEFHLEQWEKLATTGLTVHVTPGTHLNLFSAPQAKGLAEKVEACLQRRPITVV